jgi:putative phosphoribosyl transferase
MQNNEVSIPVNGIHLSGDLQDAKTGALILFAHGSGSSRHSPRNQFVSQCLCAAGFGTLLFDLLTAEEERAEAQTRHLRFNVELLAERLVAATKWVLTQQTKIPSTIGYFGSSTGAAAALMAAVEMRERVGAVVSRGGRPDLAGNVLDYVNAPTLLIVGGADTDVITLNEMAYARLRCEKGFQLVPGATHLFEEPGALSQVADMASEWFLKYLPQKPTRTANPERGKSSARSKSARVKIRGL